MARIAYFYREMSEYIEIDLRLLRDRHEVAVFAAPTRWPRPLATWRAVAASDVVMSWFASWHALLPALFARLLRRPFVLVIGGYDTARLPGIGYGHGRGGFKGSIAGAVLRLATLRLAVSEFALSELRERGIRDGRSLVVPLGLDPGRYAAARPREADLVVTVGGVCGSNLTRKGLEPFVRAAALCPELRFVVIGPWLDDAVEHLRALATPNVTFTGWMGHDEKVAWLARAAVIVQASQHEAFGLSVAEGMLCGATPVVTAAGSLPWLTGGIGVIVPGQELAPLADAIRAACALAPRAGEAARARVLAEFTVARRAVALAAALERCGVPQRPGRPGEHEAGRLVA